MTTHLHHDSLAIARAAYWFNPLMWLAARQVAMESEGACDDLVLNHETKASDYAEHLLTVAVGLNDDALLPLAAIAMARTSRVEGRLLAILDANRNRRSLSAAAIVLVPTLLAAGLLPLAIVRAGEESGDHKKAASQAITPALSPATQPVASPKTQEAKVVEPLSIYVIGHVIDDATGKPVSSFQVQGGRVDDKDPAKITWGYSLQTTLSANPTGRFSTNVAWATGWRARIVADGYVGEPILTNAPEEGATAVRNIVVRLKRGRHVAGHLYDFSGKPVSGARVLVVGNPSINLTGGATQWVDGKDEGDSGIRITTDASGAFAVTGVADDRRHIAVTCPALDLWVVEVPQVDGDINNLDIRLPQPGKLVVHYDIPGAPEKCKLFVQLHTWEMPGWSGVTSQRYDPIKQRVEFVLDNLPPGDYTIDRAKNPGLKSPWEQALLDRRTVRIESGKTTVTDFVRLTGSPIAGQVIGLDQAEVAKAKPQRVYVRVVPNQEDQWRSVNFDKVAMEGGDKPIDGHFTTERILPGQYKVRAEVFIPETEEQRHSTGIVPPAFEGEALVTVPENGPPEPVRIELRPFKFPSRETR